MDNAKDLLNMFEDVLDTERQAILDGELGRLERLVVRKDEILTGLKHIVPSESIVTDHLKLKAEKNQQLLLAAMNGIKSVMRRLDEIQSIQGSLSTYDSHGQSQKLMHNASGALAKRA